MADTVSAPAVPDQRAAFVFRLAQDRACGAGVDSLPAQPVRPEVMRQACANTEKTIQDFNGKANFISQPAQRDRAFPERVIYPKHCPPEMCLTISERDSFFYADLLVAFHSLPRKLGVAHASMCFQDLVLAIYCFDAMPAAEVLVEPTRVCFVACPVFIGQSGNHPAEAIFDELYCATAMTPPLTLEALVGHHLKFCTGAFVQPDDLGRLRSPMGRQARGQKSVRRV